MEISPENWRESSIHGIKLAQTIIERSDRDMETARQSDPLPLLRDACIRLSNDKIRAYMRAARAVVAKLRRRYVEVNEEIKSANRCRESLEKALEHMRKDMALNDESRDIRTRRPQREKVSDGKPGYWMVGAGKGPATLYHLLSWIRWVLSCHCISHLCLA